MKNGCCDALGCIKKPNYECGCRRCSIEPHLEERFHTCKEHMLDVDDQHYRVRNRTARWVLFSPDCNSFEVVVLEQNDDMNDWHPDGEL